MKTAILAFPTVLALAAPAFAAGDVAAGEQAFALCKACHSVVTPAGEALVKGGKLGPNLFGVVGRQVANDSGYALYGDAIRSVGATGLIFSARELESYMTDPAQWIRERTGNPDSKSRMTGKTPGSQADIVAYLQSLRQ